MKLSVTLTVLLWVALFLLGAMVRTSQSPVETKNRIPNPYQDSRALEYGNPRATYRPLTETWRMK